MQKPRLIIIGGSLATGKSTVSEKVSVQLCVPIVSMDRIKEAFFGVGGFRDREWSKHIGRVAWSAFKEMVELYLSRGESVIAEATFTWADDKDWIEELQSRYGMDVFQVWLTSDPRVARQRFVDRMNSGNVCRHCDEIDEVLDEFDQRYFNRTFIPLPLSASTLIVDTTDRFPDDEEILAFLRDGVA